MTFAGIVYIDDQYGGQHDRKSTHLRMLQALE